MITFGNIIYVFLFGWWISLIYLLICPVMFLTILLAPYGMYPIKQLHHSEHCSFSRNLEHGVILCLFFCLFRQALFKDGMVLHLAVWEVVRKGYMIYSILTSQLTFCVFGFQYLSAIANVTATCSLDDTNSFHRILLSSQAGDVVKRSILKPPAIEVIPEERDSEDSKDLVRDKDSAPLLVSSPIPVEIPVPIPPAKKTSNHWVSKTKWP